MINTNEVLKALYNILDSQNKQDNNARLLSLEEILDCNEDLQVDFSSMGLVPVFDIYDNDYICYQTKNGKWCVFNIVDSISFKNDSTLQDLLKLKS